MYLHTWVNGSPSSDINLLIKSLEMEPFPSVSRIWNAFKSFSADAGSILSHKWEIFLLLRIWKKDQILGKKTILFYLCSANNWVTCGKNRDKWIAPFESSSSVAEIISFISFSDGTHPVITNKNVWNSKSALFY